MKLEFFLNRGICRYPWACRFHHLFPILCPHWSLHMPLHLFRWQGLWPVASSVGLIPCSLAELVIGFCLCTGLSVYILILTLVLLYGNYLLTYSLPSRQEWLCYLTHFASSSSINMFVDWMKSLCVCMYVCVCVWKRERERIHQKISRDTVNSPFLRIRWNWVFWKLSSPFR